MSIQVKLFVDDNEFIVEQHYFSFFQKTDFNGRPINKPMNRTFDFMIHGSRDSTFFEWTVHPTMMKNCKIVFSSPFGISKSTTIELLDTYCLHYKLHYVHNSTSSFMVYFSLSPATILVDGQPMLSHFWRKTDPALIGQPIIEREEEEKEPVFNSIEYFDEQENEIEETRFTNISKIKVGVSNIDDGETIDIIMQRKNGDGVIQNQKEITFSGLVDDGYAVLEKVEMKRDWEITNENNEETD